MSAARQRKKPTKKRPIRKSALRAWIGARLAPLRKHLPAILAIGILAGVPFALGKYFEFGIADPWDSSSYVYSANHILHGAKIGVDETPTAHIGTLLVNMLGVTLFGYSETGPKFIQTILQLSALVVMFVALRRLYGVLAAVVGVILASVYLSAPVIAQGGNVKEQHMIACMVVGMSFFVLYHLGGRWWYALLAGAFVSWGPLFKPTGVSALGGLGLFVLLQPLLGHRTWKQMGTDVLLLFGGALAALGPLYVWIYGWGVQLSPPYSFLWGSLAKYLPFGSPSAGAASDYILYSRKLVPFSRQYPTVLRYYTVLMLPIALAVASILVRVLFLVRPKLLGKELRERAIHRFVLLFAGWWILDMALVWLSPRSYKQYYLPLNASAAMLGVYLVGIYAYQLRAARDKTRWIILGLLGLVLMIGMSWHIFFGVRRSPFGGGKLATPQSGYAQKWQEVAYLRKNKAPWERVGDYIQSQSEPTDTMYVWGWFPGIYVRAQRFSAAAKACLIPRTAPQTLAEIVADLITQFEQRKPKFIVDSRKRHIPTDRPAYELWPIAEFQDKVVRFLPPDPRITADYDKMWAQFLRQSFDDEEAQRYEVLAPLRKYIMENYEVAERQRYRPVQSALGLPTLICDPFGVHVVFVRK